MLSFSRCLTLASTLALGAVLALQPLSLTGGSFGIGSSKVLAKGGDGGGGGGGGGGAGGGGNGGSNGGGGGNGGGNGGGGGSGGAGGGRGGESGGRSGESGGRSEPSGRGAERSEKAERTEREKVERTEREKVEKTERTEKLPGRLNAANASPQAMQRANPNSAVGQIAAYKAIMQGSSVDIEAAAKALSRVANKSLSLKTVQELDARLHVSVDPAIEQQVFDRARDLQAR